MTREEIAAFQVEMDILRKLDHPNILKLHEVFEDTRKFFLVTEFCDGCELFDEIANHHHFNERTAANYVEQIVRAVVYCHSMGIVHRDLKPENILIDAEQDGIVKLIDFGTSAVYSRGSETLKGVFGTAYYIAPEVVRKKGYDERCDVWSIGVMIYILLSGAAPFDDPDNDDEKI